MSDITSGIIKSEKGSRTEVYIQCNGRDYEKIENAGFYVQLPQTEFLKSILIFDFSRVSDKNYLKIIKQNTINFKLVGNDCEITRLDCVPMGIPYTDRNNYRYIYDWKICKFCAKKLPCGCSTSTEG